MATLKFQAKMLIREGNPYIHITKEQATRLKPSWKKPLPVLVQINGEPKPAWRINMMPIGDGDFYLYLHGDVRKASDTKVGDVVTVKVSFDDKYENGPMHPMPLWFIKALQNDKTAEENWENLPPSRQKEILRYFSWLKSQAAIDRNLVKVMHVLSGKPGRFMARSWKDGK